MDYNCGACRPSYHTFPEPLESEPACPSARSSGVAAQEPCHFRAQDSLRPSNVVSFGVRYGFFKRTLARTPVEALLGGSEKNRITSGTLTLLLACKGI